MSKDIRSYFSKINGSSSSSKSKVSKPATKKRTCKVLESDSEDDDMVIIKQTPKKQKKSDNESKKNEETESKSKKSKEVIMKVDVESFFGKTRVHQKPQNIKHVEKSQEVKPGSETTKKSSKSKKSKATEEKNVQEMVTFADDEFDESFMQIDEEQLQAISSADSSLITSTPPKENTSDSKPESSKKTSSSSKKEKSQKAESSSKVTSSSSEKKKEKEVKVKGKEEKKLNIITPKKENESKNAIKEEIKTPTNSKNKDPVVESEQKRKSAMAYQRYLNRSGPRNPGSKKIPKGSPKCLQGKTFVISGVLDSLEREEAVELIQKCGGRVTSSISKKTSYIVIGEDAGESKLQKAISFGTTQLTEDDLLDLIRTTSGELIECDSSSDIIESTPKKESPKKKKQEVEEESKYFKEDSNKLKRKRKSSASDDSGKNKEAKLVISESDFYSSSGSKTADDKKSVSKVNDVPSQSASVSSTSDAKKVEKVSDSTPSTDKQYDLGDMLWVDKYKPKTTKQIIGQSGEKSNVKKLTKWLQDWYKNHSATSGKKTRPAPWAQNDDGSFFKAVLLSGSPGVGKTTSVHLVCKELGFDIVEFNASDTRSKRLLHEDVSELLSTKSIKNLLEGNKETRDKHVLVMDEVDGMAGNEDRGGIQELIQLIKNTKIPIICMCNDRNHPKIRSLVNYCFDLRFNRPRLEQIKGAMKSICFKEGINIPSEALDEIIIGSNQDVRQVLHNLSLWVARDRGLSTEQAKIDAAKAKKSLHLGPWDVARKVFSLSEHSKMSLREKEELFFQDYSLGPLFVQDGYLRVRPSKAQNDKKKALHLISKAADSILWGDIIERRIRSDNAWSLLPVQAIFSSVVPGNVMEGYIQGQIQFPAWLGKNSKRNKFDRLLQELQVHMRLSITGSKEAVNLDYLQHLRDAVIKPLTEKGMDGIQEAVQVMLDYHLTREDLDSILELMEWPGSKDLYASIDSKVKAAFTRAYNKEGKATPYATNVSIKKVSSNIENDPLEENEEAEIDEDEENVEADAMIKVQKPKLKKTENKSKKSESESSTSKGGKNKGPRKEKKGKNV